MTVTYNFSTGVPNITPAVYASDDIGGEDLNATPTVTDSSGVLSLDLDVGDYVAQWDWEGDTHQTAGTVTPVDSDTWQTSTSGPSGAVVVPSFEDQGNGIYLQPVTGIVIAYTLAESAETWHAIEFDPAGSNPLLAGLSFADGNTTLTTDRDQFFVDFRLYLGTVESIDNTVAYSLRLRDLDEPGDILSVGGNPGSGSPVDYVGSRWSWAMAAGRRWQFQVRFGGASGAASGSVTIDEFATNLNADILAAAPAP